MKELRAADTGIQEWGLVRYEPSNDTMASRAFAPLRERLDVADPGWHEAQRPRAINEWLFSRIELIAQVGHSAKQGGGGGWNSPSCVQSGLTGWES